MRSRLAFVLALSLALLVALPVDALGVQGPGLAPSAPVSVPIVPGPRLVSVSAHDAAWSLDLGISIAAADGVETPAAGPKGVCALGDVDGDGHDDILVRVKPGQADGHHKFEARAGPDLTRVLWQALPRDAKLMKCASDVTGDGVQDPIVVTPPTESPPEIPDSPLTGGEASTVTNFPLDGGDGASLSEIDVTSSSSSADLPGASAGTAQGGEVLPAGEGALLVVDATQTGVDVGLAGPGLAAGGSQVVVEVVDERGVPLGTIESPPQADALAVAPLPQADGLPDVVFLTEVAASPLGGVPAGLPTVTLSDGAGTVQWTADQDPTVGAAVLIPEAGDVDGDGVGDLIYATVPAETPTLPAAGYTVISGADGSAILDSGAPQDGLSTALPLGDVGGDAAAEILVVDQPQPGQDITVSAQGDGEVLWTVRVDGEATPANTVTDPASGNTVGFSDLTGDGVPDVAVTTPTDTGIAVEVIDGATGEVAWSDEFEGADSVTSVPADDGGDDLVVVDDDGGLSVTAVDGATGATEWTTEGEGGGSDRSEVTPIGDVDGDGVGDLLVTVGPAGVDGAIDPDGPGSSHILSGNDGTPLWSADSSGSGDSGLTLHGGEAEAGSKPAPAWTWSTLALAAALVALLTVAVRARRRRGPPSP